MKSKLSEIAPATEAIAAKLTEAVPTIEAASATAIDATMSSLKDGMAQATAGFGSTQVKVKEGMQKAMKTAEEFVTFSQGNMEAVVKSSQIWAAGIQDLSKHVAASAQASMDETMATFKAWTSIKSLRDAFDLQAAYARSAMEKTVAESGRLTDASLKLAEQAMAPITARVSVAVEKFAKAA